ncbi:hypothetical protein CPB83DRAFT_603170 [Crepidotus variabilis]|uniref:Uncharacterized protein n=1 Tax=Crepidotus variabilis TaxID=179855 RepID=A0A9P6E8F6_9AGAR|nr:hypothetical protein CPB83DRAFT_603170 [Crepidotus variabilis]
MEKQQKPMQVEQPTPIEPMSVRNLNARDVPVDGKGKRGWSTPLLCSCKESPGLFLTSVGCPCLVNNRNLRRIRHLEANNRPHPRREKLFNKCSIFVICLEIMCEVTPTRQLHARHRIRHRYHIRGGFWTDICTSLWCQPCSLVQSHREIQFEEEYLVEQFQSEDVDMETEV